MIMPRAFLSSAPAVDPAEVRRLVQIGRERGLIRDGSSAAKIEKNGHPAVALGNVRSQWMDIGPDLAAKWLENNFRNRSLDEGVVAAYARDMVNGVWVPTHQGIAFNDRDELIDGQHRLRAIIVSQKTILTMVTFGLPSEIKGQEMTTMDAVDRGRTRSVADQLKIQHGLANGSAIAMICNSLSQLCCGERTRRLSVGQTLDVYRAFEHAITYVIIHRSTQVGLRQAGVRAAFSLALVTEDGFFGGATPIAEMYSKLLDGGGLKERSPIKKLRDFLMSDEAKLITQRLNRGVAELTLQAIYLETLGRSVAKLNMSLDGADHFRSLQKERVEKIAAIFRLPAA